MKPWCIVPLYLSARGAVLGSLKGRVCPLPQARSQGGGLENFAPRKLKITIAFMHLSLARPLKLSLEVILPIFSVLPGFGPRHPFENFHKEAQMENGAICGKSLNW